MNIETYIGDLKLLVNQEIPVNKDELVKIILNEDDMQIHFKILVDLSKKKYEIEEKIENKVLFLILYNYEDSHNAGLQAPVSIGTLNGSQVYLSFYVTRVYNQNEEYSYILNYSILLKSK